MKIPWLLYALLNETQECVAVAVRSDPLFILADRIGLLGRDVCSGVQIAQSRQSTRGQLPSSVCFRLGSAFGGERAFVGCAVLVMHTASGAGPVRQETVRKVGVPLAPGYNLPFQETGETGCSGESLWNCPAQLVQRRCMRCTSAATPRRDARRRRWDCHLQRPSRSWPGCSVILFRPERKSTARSGDAALDVGNGGR